MARRPPHSKESFCSDSEESPGGMYLWGTPFFPPPFGRWFALLGVLLYASRWHAQESSIGRLWGDEAPQSRGYHRPPQSRVRGGFLLREKAPPTPKETASYQSTANYIVVIEQLPPPIGRIVRFITAKLACARAYTKVARVYER